MLEKKLLTLCCVIGILAFGACFLPPIQDHPPARVPVPPPPPEVTVDLRGVRVIQVVADNTSASHQVDPSELAGWVAARVNDQSQRTNVSARAEEIQGAEAAVLKITIVNESAEHNRVEAGSEMASWLLRIEVTATLTRGDGTELRQITDASFKRYFALPENDQTLWKEVRVKQWMAFDMSAVLVDKMFYGK